MNNPAIAFKAIAGVIILKNLPILSGYLYNKNTVKKL